MFITIITDCKDDNAKGRSTTRTAMLFNNSVNYVGVENDLEAAGNLIDILDAGSGEEGIILVNVAPRHKEAKKWENGTPFGYFYYKKTLVVSSIDGLTLSLVKKYNLVKEINLMDIPTVLDNLTKQKMISQNLSNHIKNTQFRSFEFLPKVANWIYMGIKIPVEKYSVKKVPNPSQKIWWIDNFGNCKTTLLPEDIKFKPGKKIKTKWGLFNCFDKLKDVPDNQPALITGSSGLNDKRFLEIVIQGKNAAKSLNLNRN